MSGGAVSLARRRRILRFTWAAASLASAGALTIAYLRFRRFLRSRRNQQQLEKWCADGPAQQPVIECQVPVSHGMDGEAEMDAVEVPIGLLFECDRLKSSLLEHLGLEDDDALIEALSSVAGFQPEDLDNAGNEAWDGSAPEPPVLNLPWLDLAALAQLTYWYDRRPHGEEMSSAEIEAQKASPEARLTDAKFGRWTKKVSREKVVYGTVALRYRTRGHLGQQVFRRPAGIDVTRLSTLRRAATLCGHEELCEIVGETMEQLQPKNVVTIPWEEVHKHSSQNDLWLLIDKKVYDVTPFLHIHPGGGQLIVDAAGKDATSLFERTHGEGLRYSLRLLNQFFIGTCDGAEKAPLADPTQCTPEFLETLRSITAALHTFDEARATGEAQGLVRRDQ